MSLHLMDIIISGGQTGADRAALEIATELGIRTGGKAPKGYMTENGPDLSLRDVYGLKEHRSSNYRLRTQVNVAASSATTLFGNKHTLGSRATVSSCHQLWRPLIINPTVEQLYHFILAYEVVILNVAGNRLSVNPGIVDVVKSCIRGAYEMLREDKRRT